ncbi:MAG: hypothetical protein Q9163_000714 [Psora crenata]
MSARAAILRQRNTDFKTVRITDLGDEEDEEAEEQDRQAKSTPDHYGLCYYGDYTEKQKEELYNLIGRGEPSVLQRAMLAIATATKYTMSYTEAEVPLLNLRYQELRLLVPTALVLQLLALKRR